MSHATQREPDGPGAAHANTAVLLYLYGPPAAGKLTIAEKVQALTGFRLFHNHVTVNAIREVFDFGSPPFVELLHSIRLDVFAAAMRAGTSLIFTNNSAWAGPSGRERFQTFAAAAARVVEEAGGSTFFVQVSAPLPVLESRLTHESRRAHGKLVDVERLRDLVNDEFDDAPLRASDLVIDTTRVSPDEAARIIAAALAQRR